MEVKTIPPKPQRANLQLILTPGEQDLLFDCVDSYCRSTSSYRVRVTAAMRLRATLEAVFSGTRNYNSEEVTAFLVTNE